jgi:hypothetical protein
MTWPAQSSYVPAGYKQVWGDEFDSLDRSNWSLWNWGHIAQTADGAGPIDFDVAQPGLSVQDGVLRLESYLDAAGAVRNPPALTTQWGKLDFLYGYLEFRANWCSTGRPSLWMRSRSRTIDRRCLAAMGEVDIFETMNWSTDPTLHGTWHPGLHKWYNEGWDTNGHAAAPWGFPATTRGLDQWAVYGFLWTPWSMEFKVDGITVGAYSLYDIADFNPQGNYRARLEMFRDPGFLIINGNHDGEAGVNLVDYVRLYQRPSEGGIYRISYDPGTGVMPGREWAAKSLDENKPLLDTLIQQPPIPPQAKRFVEWNTSAEGTGRSYQPGDRYRQALGATTLRAIYAAD